jgi:hypothetical protein
VCLGDNALASGMSQHKVFDDLKQRLFSSPVISLLDKPIAPFKFNPTWIMEEEFQIFDQTN